MKILIGSDVDPILPGRLARVPDGDAWETLDRIPALRDAMGSDLPPITWLIRSDASVRFSTGDFASGYLSRQDTWTELVQEGHELGWHMHLLSFDEAHGAFVFDAEPDWLSEAYGALARHFPVQATRIGWDFANEFLFRQLDRLGVRLDFSALPGCKAWYRAGSSRITVDWLDCSELAYRPGAGNYQKPSGDSLRLIEVPIAHFRNSNTEVIKRLARRLQHGCLSLNGLRNKIRMLNEKWESLPCSSNDVWAFHFHPEDLTAQGIENFVDNVNRLRTLPDVEFLTASAVREWYDSKLPEPRTSS